MQSNIPESIKFKQKLKLHNLKNHPIEILKTHIYKYFNSLHYDFKIYDNLDPVVTIQDNFDKLLIPLNHPARSKSDTYYINDNLVLRTHTSAHQNNLLSNKERVFLVTGDVYRKDEINKTHYPIFHQMEGVIIFDKVVDEQLILKEILSGLVKYLFGDVEYRFNDDYFPFTTSSLEVEVKYRNEWLEILGCGVIHSEILKNNNITTSGIAFGLGIDRLCMILFDIPDIRLLWNLDEKFLSQFSDGKIKKFIPYSKFDSMSRDISFYVLSGSTDKIQFNENELYEIIRAFENTEILIEEVKLIDTFKNSKTYRIIYNVNHNITNHSLFTELVNKSIHPQIVSKIIDTFNIQIR